MEGSCFKRDKTDLRSTMLQDRPSVLTILKFESEMLYLIKIATKQNIIFIFSIKNTFLLHKK